MIDIQISYKFKEYFDVLNKNTFLDVINKCLLNADVKSRCPENSSISVYLTDNEEIQNLNKQYRNIDLPTDVLTFAQRDDDTFTSDTLGDIVISVPYLQSNSELIKIDKNEEIIRLLIHGFLHLLGFDHTTNNFETEEMLILQEELLKL